MLESYLVDQCTKVETTRDEYGQEITGTTATLSCRWRDITSVRRGAHMETSEADGQVWFAPTADVSKGTILQFEGDYYQVEKITRAKRLGETTPQFLKCEVVRTTIGIS